MRPLALALVLLTLAGPAAAWTRPAHMVTAAIAHDEITRARPDLLATLEKILDAHPDRGPFEVAIDRTTEAERARRMFLECARWPDDARRTTYDHPTWHAVLWPIVALYMLLNDILWPALRPLIRAALAAQRRWERRGP